MTSGAFTAAGACRRRGGINRRRSRTSVTKSGSPSTVTGSKVDRVPSTSKMAIPPWNRSTTRNAVGRASPGLRLRNGESLHQQSTAFMDIDKVGVVPERGNDSDELIGEFESAAHCSRVCGAILSLPRGSDLLQPIFRYRRPARI